LKKNVDGNQRNWHMKLTKALRASMTTPKDSTRMTPYLLFYGKEEKNPINLKLNTLIFMVNIEDTEDTSPTQKRINQLLKLEEERSKALNRTSQRQQIIKKYFDQSTNTKNLQKGELVLLWNKGRENPSMHMKFEAIWIRPYVVEKILGFNPYMLQYMK
jgi:hypothetical protein